MKNLIFLAKYSKKIVITISQLWFHVTDKSRYLAKDICRIIVMATVIIEY